MSDFIETVLPVNETGEVVSCCGENQHWLLGICIVAMLFDFIALLVGMKIVRLAYKDLRPGQRARGRLVITVALMFFLVCRAVEKGFLYTETSGSDVSKEGIIARGIIDSFAIASFTVAYGTLLTLVTQQFGGQNPVSFFVPVILTALVAVVGLAVGIALPIDAYVKFCSESVLLVAFFVVFTFILATVPPSRRNDSEQRRTLLTILMISLMRQVLQVVILALRLPTVQYLPTNGVDFPHLMAWVSNDSVSAFLTIYVLWVRYHRGKNAGVIAKRFGRASESIQLLGMHMVTLFVIACVFGVYGVCTNPYICENIPSRFIAFPALARLSARLFQLTIPLLYLTPASYFRWMYIHIFGQRFDPHVLVSFHSYLGYINAANLIVHMVGHIGVLSLVLSENIFAPAYRFALGWATGILMIFCMCAAIMSGHFPWRLRHWLMGNCMAGLAAAHGWMMIFGTPIMTIVMSVICVAHFAYSYGYLNVKRTHSADVLEFKELGSFIWLVMRQPDRWYQQEGSGYLRIYLPFNGLCTLDEMRYCIRGHPFSIASHLEERLHPLEPSSGCNPKIVRLLIKFPGAGKLTHRRGFVRYFSTYLSVLQRTFRSATASCIPEASQSFREIPAVRIRGPFRSPLGLRVFDDADVSIVMAAGSGIAGVMGLIRGLVVSGTRRIHNHALSLYNRDDSRLAVAPQDELAVPMLSIGEVGSAAPVESSFGFPVILVHIIVFGSSSRDSDDSVFWNAICDWLLELRREALIIPSDVEHVMAIHPEVRRDFFAAIDNLFSQWFLHVPTSDSWLLQHQKEEPEFRMFLPPDPSKPIPENFVHSPKTVPTQSVTSLAEEPMDPDASADFLSPMSKKAENDKLIQEVKESLKKLQSRKTQNFDAMLKALHTREQVWLRTDALPTSYGHDTPWQLHLREYVSHHLEKSLNVFYCGLKTGADMIHQDLDLMQLAYGVTFIRTFEAFDS